jgi:aspartate 1-decarboxylase
MVRTFLNSKIHKATVTDSRIDYEGSCVIDSVLLNAAGIKPYEKIDIYNITNGERFSTYAIEGEADTGTICINGAACHKATINDKIIICTYADLAEAEYLNHKPTVIHVDNRNKIMECESYSNVSLVEK